MRLLNILVDTLEIKGFLRDLHPEVVDKFYTLASGDKNYKRRYLFDQCDNINLFIADAEPGQTRRRFKIKFGAVACLSRELCLSALELLDIESARVNWVDIAFDYTGLDIKQHFDVLTIKNQVIDKQMTRIKTGATVCKFACNGRTTGYAIDRIGKFYIRVYDKIQEQKDKPNEHKTAYVNDLGVDNITRVEFSIVSYFQKRMVPYDPDRLIDPSYYMSFVKKYILNKVKPLNKDASAILRNFIDIPQFKAPKYESSGILYKQLMNMGIGKIVSSFRYLHDDPQRLEEIKEEINDFVHELLINYSAEVKAKKV